VTRVLLVLLLLAPRVAVAHSLQMGFLEIVEVSPGSLRVSWRPPPGSKLQPTFSAHCQQPTTVSLDCGARGLDRVALVGPRAETTDVLLRTVALNGEEDSRVVRPTGRGIAIDTPSHPAAGRSTLTGYIVLGIEHICLGWDHLLFVLALLLLVRRTRRLVATITAFTVAHSITLALVTLDVLALPLAPTEALIAATLVVLAADVVRGRDTLLSRRPYLASFGFGLLHGLGFAEALRELGIPEADVAPALVGFNLGVEVGQLAFVVSVLAMVAVGRWLRWRPAVLRAATAYAIGALGFSWTIERVVRFWS